MPSPGQERHHGRRWWFCKELPNKDKLRRCRVACTKGLPNEDKLRRYLVLVMSEDMGFKVKPRLLVGLLNRYACWHKLFLQSHVQHDLSWAATSLMDISNHTSLRFTNIFDECSSAATLPIISHNLTLLCDMAISVFIFCAAFAAATVIYYLSKIVYNYYFHPLAHIPGPWWAAVSYLPEFYYDVIKGGRYFTVILRMHERYGEPSSDCTDSSTLILAVQAL